MSIRKDLARIAMAVAVAASMATACLPSRPDTSTRPVAATEATQTPAATGAVLLTSTPTPANTATPAPTETAQPPSPTPPSTEIPAPTATVVLPTETLPPTATKAPTAELSREEKFEIYLKTVKLNGFEDREGFKQFLREIVRDFGPFDFEGFYKKYPKFPKGKYEAYGDPAEMLMGVDYFINNEGEGYCGGNHKSPNYNVWVDFSFFVREWKEALVEASAKSGVPVSKKLLTINDRASTLKESRMAFFFKNHSNLTDEERDMVDHETWLMKIYSLEVFANTNSDLTSGERLFLGEFSGEMAKQAVDFFGY